MTQTAQSMLAAATKARHGDPYPPVTRLHFQTALEVARGLEAALGVIRDQLPEGLADDMATLRFRLDTKVEAMRDAEARQMIDERKRA